MKYLIPLVLLLAACEEEYNTSLEALEQGIKGCHQNGGTQSFTLDHWATDALKIDVIVRCKNGTRYSYTWHDPRDPYQTAPNIGGAPEEGPTL